jgi:hypothetical protein
MFHEICEAIYEAVLNKFHIVMYDYITIFKNVGLSSLENLLSHNLMAPLPLCPVSHINTSFSVSSSTLLFLSTLRVSNEKDHCQTFHTKP